MFERAECRYQDLFSIESVPTFESNIAYTLRFMIDTKVCYSADISFSPFIVRFQVVGMNWIEVPAGKYHVMSDNGKRSGCQIEFSMRFVLNYVPLREGC